MASFRLQLLGPPGVRGGEGLITGKAAQRHRLALLALLSIAPAQTLSRDKLIAWLWPESDTRRARHLLSVSLHEIRKSLGEGAVLSPGDDLQLNTEVVEADVLAFRSALAEGDVGRALAQYAGPFLDGFHLGDNLEFEEWADGVRARLAGEHEAALETLAAQAEEAGDPLGAARWWRRLAREQPYSGRIAVRVMESLAAGGDRGGALRHALEHDALMRRELGTRADSEVAVLADRLRAESAGEGAFTPQPLEGTVPEKLPPLTPDAGERLKPAYGEPTRHLRLGAGWIALLSLLLIGGDSPPAGGHGQRWRVLVVTLDNETGDADLERIGRMASDWIAKGVEDTGRVEIVSQSMFGRLVRGLGVDDTLSPEEVARRLARDASADLVVTGAYYRERDDLLFRVEIGDPETGEILRAIEGVRTPVDAPIGGVETLRHRVGGSLSTILDPRMTHWAHAASQPPSLAAYRMFAEGLDEFFQFDWKDAAIRFELASAVDSTFTAPLIWANYAYGNGGQPARGDSIVAALDRRRDRLAAWDRAMVEVFQHGDLRGRYHALQRVVEIAPGSEWHYNLGSAAMELNRPREAFRQLTQVDPDAGWLADWHPYWRLLMRVSHQLGEYQRELEVARRARERWPENHFIAYEEARALVGLDRVSEALEAVEKVPTSPTASYNPASGLAMLAVELRAHGHEAEARRAFDRAFELFDRYPTFRREHPYIFGWLLYEGGRWGEARVQFERLRADTSMAGDIDIEGYLAILAARRGDRAEALRFAQRLAALEEEPAAGQPPLEWRARIAAVLGEREEAVDLLRKLLNEEEVGWESLFDGFHYMIDYESLRDYPPFRELTRPKG